MLARLRRLLPAFLLKTPVFVAFGLLLAYLIFGWFGFEPLVKWAAPKYVSDKSGHHLIIRQAKFDPLALSLRLGGVDLTEPDGKRLLAFDEFFVDYETSGVLRGAFAFKDIRIVGPDVHLVLNADGSLNWSALLEAFKSEEQDESKDLPRLLIDHIALEKGQVHITDHKSGRGLKTSLHDLHFELSDLSTLPDDKGAYVLSTRLSNGAQMRWKGDLSLNPILATGQLALDDLRLDKVWPYLKDHLNLLPPQGVASLGFSYRVAYANEKLALVLDDLGVQVSGLKLQGKDTPEPAIALDSFHISGGRFDLEQQHLELAKVALQGGYVHVQRRIDGSVDLSDWIVASPTAEADTDAGTEIATPGAKTASKAGESHQFIIEDLGTIAPGQELRLGGLAFAYKSTRLQPEAQSRLDQVAQALQGKPELQVEVGGHTDSVGSETYNQKVSLDRAEAVKAYLVSKGIAGERIAARGYGESMPVADNGTETGRASNRRVVLRFHLASLSSPNAQSDQPAPGVWRVSLGGFLLDGLAVGYRDAGFEAPLSAEIGNVHVAFKAQAQIRPDGPQVQVDGLGVDLSAIQLGSAAVERPILVLESIHLEGGSLDLAAQEARVSRLAFVNGRMEALRDVQGNIPLLGAFMPATSPPATPTAAAVSDTVSPGAIPVGKGEANMSPWKYRLDALNVSGFEVALSDQSVHPAASINLHLIQATASGLSQDLQASVPVKLSLGVREGGAFRAEGKVVPGKAKADLRLSLNSLSLKPVQPYVTQAARLTLASGVAAGSGHLVYGPGVNFDGGFKVSDLLLNETDGGARFLAWKQLSSDSVRVRPEALNIEELKVDGLGAKLVIYADKSINLKKILKSEATASPTVMSSATPSTTPTPGVSAGLSHEPAHLPLAAGEKPDEKVANPGPPTRMTIDRIRVENSELEFADLSLALPFGTRIHDFNGAFNGISTEPGTAAQLEFDGQVDEYGLARAVGQLNLFDPTDFMDIKVVFRNVEMTRLTPYTATFVGRKIDSGKLSLDLEYKIKSRQLLGENQIIMDKLTLGERVESPTAKNLPLDLAIAILQDSDGRIDLGLPVSGSLDDPQFSYSRIIWKAIGNIITKIVTAPFRALASLFGGNGEKLESIAFEAGEQTLTPPEKEKFKQIATILAKRPGLALTIHPTWSADLDRPAIKEARVRRAVAEKMGLKLSPGEDPGPVSTANAKVQEALATLYAERMGADAWKSLQGKWLQANPDKNTQSGVGKLMSRLKGLMKKEAPLSDAEFSALKGSDLYGLVYEQLLAKELVNDADLQTLARKRGEAIVSGLVAAGATAERVRLGDVEPNTQDAKAVPTRMELGVAKNNS